jgi:hypothetical protein
MRLLKVTLLGVLFVVMIPARSDAWFGLLDRLSGPGKFYGALYDVRLVCFGPRSPVVDNLEVAMANASASSIRPVATVAPDTRDPRTAAWMTFADALENTRQKFPVVSSTDIEAFSKAVGALETRDFDFFNAQINQLGNQVKPLSEVSLPALPTLPPFRPIGTLAEVMRRGQRLIEQFHRANVSINSTGVLASFCTPSKQRRFAVEVGADFYQANSNPKFANDYTIRLVTLVPSLTYRVFTNTAYDVVDVGTGVGVYWFSSRGFEDFSGLVLQPIHFDFHGPTAWVNSDDLARLFSLVTFRFGFTRFPAGFKEGAFGPGTEAIPAEWTKTLALYFDLMPFLRRPKHLFGIQ